jgi:hypothetical protein
MKNKNKKIDRKQALKKMGRYAGLTALGTFMLLNPKKLKPVPQHLRVMVGNKALF